MTQQMRTSRDTNKEDNNVPDKTLPECNSKRDFRSNIISQIMLKQIVQKAYEMKVRNSHVMRFVEKQKLKHAKEFVFKNCDESLQNFCIKPEQLSPKIVNQQCLGSPTKSPYSFLNYEQMEQQSDQANISLMPQGFEERKNTLKNRKDHNCNKIYILRRKSLKMPSSDKNSSVQSIKINQTLPSAFSKPTQRSEMYKISINNKTTIYSRPGNKLATDSFGTAQNTTRSLIIPRKNSIYPSSFRDQTPNQKDEEDHNKLIKLDGQKMRKSGNYEPKEKQTNEYIAFLRQRKQKLQNIMKVFDLDDMQKKTQKIQRENLLRENKQQNITEIYSKIPSTTTDYDGNLVYIHEPVIKNQGSQPNQKKSTTRLPKYDPHDQGVLSHNVSFKVKEMDDKTKNFLNQIFSSACGTPLKSSKKLGFNMKNLETSKKKIGQKTEKYVGSKMSLSSQSKKDEFQKPQKDSATSSYDFNTNKSSKNVLAQTKGLKSALKIPLKSVNDSQHSKGKNKQNIEQESTFGNFKFSDLFNPKEKNVMKTDGSSRSNISNKSFLKQFETTNHEGHNNSLKQKTLPTFTKRKKTATNSTQYECSKIEESSNQTSQKNINQSEVQPLKTFFEGFMKNM